MSDPRLAAKLDEVMHDLDMLVFRLEREPSLDLGVLHRDRNHVRQELERLRDQVADLLRET
ncbi:MAG: hypothetical protein JRI25_19790 [Deltaproteobacteria bacterium]|nr:hypothetical protein [Deltaproteobacteria bacterium]MBW2256817.1 hypothetical protein [Deltaproteobacteria bacterium]